MGTYKSICSILHIAIQIALGCASTWSEWWTYEGISGPDFWGLVNPEWYMCTRGKRQSPINIDPKQLLFDPMLGKMKVDQHTVSATLVNNGHDLRLVLDDQGTPPNYNISGGPLSYQYRVSDVILHYGNTDTTGSEHTINGVTFPAEVQILGYNTELYGNMTQAIHSTTGLAMISVLVQIGKKSNPEFDNIAQYVDNIRQKGHQHKMRHISISSLLPDTDNYVTYEGSLTQPGCQETVTWIIYNKPIYISQRNLRLLRTINQGDPTNPKMSLSNSFRPIVLTNQRTVRTNINFNSPNQNCNMARQNFYQANVLEYR